MASFHPQRKNYYRLPLTSSILPIMSFPSIVLKNYQQKKCNFLDQMGLFKLCTFDINLLQKSFLDSWKNELTIYSSKFFQEFFRQVFWGSLKLQKFIGFIIYTHCISLSTFMSPYLDLLQTTQKTIEQTIASSLQHMVWFLPGGLSFQLINIFMIFISRLPLYSTLLFYSSTLFSQIWCKAFHTSLQLFKNLSIFHAVMLNLE